MAVWPAYYRAWGKGQRSEEDVLAYHLLVFHCLDVAAVGVTYLKQSPALIKGFCQLLHCTESAFLSWAGFLLALHDLGKFSEAFQMQRPDLVEALCGQVPDPAKVYIERHDSLGFWLWCDDLVEDGILSTIGIGGATTDNYKKMNDAVEHWVRAVTGHHGVPPKINSGISTGRYFSVNDKKNAAYFVQDVAALLLTEDARNIPILTGSDFEKNSRFLSWWFAGVTVLADWLGSNTHFFPYQEQPQILEDYWTYAQEQADKALMQSGVIPAAIQAGQTFTDFFPHIHQPSPLQQWAISVDISPVPQIYVLEDVTGAGKTEAAMMLAYRLMMQGAASGIFIGLPTMATANAMYQRVARVYQKLFVDNANLTLTHAFRNLVEEFTDSILSDVDTPEEDDEQQDETATARCTAWLADHSKRALLASVGVGTVDQALLAVLYSKHQSLRLLGLFNKVLIIDEVHACDTYMHGVLKVLLKFHARSGGSVILLSATLTNKMKQDLLNAYAEGRNQNDAPMITSDAYPLATRWQDGESVLQEKALASRENVSRRVLVHYESSEDKVFAYIREALQQGKCVGWIRNTVADAMDAYEHLSHTIAEEKLTLFHARFTLQDRLEKEEQALRYFGGESGQRERQGRLMIATQVAEQSLDVDFDVLITDLAPIDRLLQRAGRLQRHVRDAKGNRLMDNGAKDQREAPCLWVFSPSWTEHPKADWYSTVFKKGQYVYPHHGQLWLTAKVLQQGYFTMPHDARQLIEMVFSDQTVFPETLSENALRAIGDDMAKASTAQFNTLILNSGYNSDGVGEWQSEVRTPSRLGEPTIEVMLAKYANGNMQPWAQGAWAYSMVKIALRQFGDVDVSSDQRKAYEHLQQTLPAQGKWCRLLPLTQRADGIWQGWVWKMMEEGTSIKTHKKAGKARALLTWLYDAQLGLRIEEKRSGEIEE